MSFKCRVVIANSTLFSEMNLIAICVILRCVLAAVVAEELDPLSNEFINLINSKQNSWKAGRNFHENTPFSYIKNLMGALKDDNLLAKYPRKQHDAELIASLPESFDPRDKWPNCPSLNEIRDQGSCGSCWAFGAVEAMTDRYCIYSNGTKNFHFSAQDMLSCGGLTGDGCNGDYPLFAWLYWLSRGVVSGGNYNSSEGCRPYEVAPCEHHAAGKMQPCGEIVETPKCLNSCLSDSVDYYADKRRGSDIYRIKKNEEDIKAELFENGPLEVSFDVYEDFVHYKQGVYKHTTGSRLGGHAVKMLGWGVENDQKYWLIANSWNTDWGDNGYFKILRGENHCGIEGSAMGGVPVIQ